MTGKIGNFAKSVRFPQTDYIEEKRQPTYIC